MSKPILVIMAAGMGSRYGGLKQVDPVGPNDEAIIDYSIYDAKRAGFETVVFIIKEAMADEFKEKVGNKVAEHMEVRYAFQELDKVPSSYEIPEGRVKPWGTAHAVLSAKDQIDSSFAVINADDFYGENAFQEIYNFLENTDNKNDDNELNLAMVAFLLKNTVSDNGYVSRGVSTKNDAGYLEKIVEKTRIEKFEGGIRYSDDDGETWNEIDGDTIVSMNMWGLRREFLDLISKYFEDFLENEVSQNPLKAEFYLPTSVEKLLDEKQANVKVLSSPDKWYGVTYKEDKEQVINAINNMIAQGKYPENLWN